AEDSALRARGWMVARHSFAGAKFRRMTGRESKFMNPEFAIELLKSTMLQAVSLAAPVLLAAMVIGLAISLFQAVTSIHEQTLTFVPKALAVVAVLVLLLPWMLRSLIEFTTAIIEKMPQMTS